MSTIEERLARDIAAVTGEVVVTESHLREAREEVDERIGNRRRRDRSVVVAAAAAAAVSWGWPDGRTCEVMTPARHQPGPCRPPRRPTQWATRPS
jgi:hypothetical protein